MLIMPAPSNPLEGKGIARFGAWFPAAPPGSRLFPSARCWLLAWLFCLLAGGAAAEPAPWASRYATRNWLREDGLPQNSVTAVLQTRDGYLWVATYNGLARFDGVRFTVFDSNSNPELHNSRLTSLFEAPDGALWIGHEALGLVVPLVGTADIRPAIHQSWLLEVENDAGNKSVGHHRHILPDIRLGGGPNAGDGTRHQHGGPAEREQQ